MDRNKKTKFAIFIAAIAAVVSAVVLVIVFWDKLLTLCPCRRKAMNEMCNAEPDVFDDPAEPEAPDYDEEERKDFADLNQAQ